ncbi:MAG: hypothetical protein U0324_15210 [Polyangiales bacterium]
MALALPCRSASLLAALALAACSSSPAAPAPDAAVAEDAAPDAAAPDAPAPDAAAPDAPAPDAPPPTDGGACEDFTGAYTLVGTCSVPGFSPFPSACIAQTGCAAQIVVTTGPTAGTVVGNELRFTSMVSGIPLECTATRGAGGVLTVRCAAGTVASCDATATPAAFPGATRWCCDPGAQDCGAGQRCNFVGAGTNNGTALTACIPAGTLAEGAACTRTDGRLGADSCGAGLSCVNYGGAGASDRACSRTCRSNADCTGGASCIGVTDAPRGGVCRPRCTPLGTDCAAGTCRHLNAWPAEMRDTAPAVTATVCQPVGAGAEGAACMSSLECGANLTCARRTGADAFACRRICDMANPCPAGTTCTGAMSATNPSAAGACIP